MYSFCWGVSCARSSGASHSSWQSLLLLRPGSAPVSQAEAFGCRPAVNGYAVCLLNMAASCSVEGRTMEELIVSPVEYCDM